MVNVHIYDGSYGKELACNAGDLGSILGQEDRLEKGMATHSSVFPLMGKSEGGGNPVC